MPELKGRIRATALGGLPRATCCRLDERDLGHPALHVATLGLIRERPYLLADANSLAQWIATSPIKDTCTAPAGLAG